MKLRNLIPLLCAVVLFCSQTTTKSQTPENQKRTLIRAGHMIDVKTGKTLDAQTIIVVGRTIQSIAPSASVAAGPGDAVIDLGSMTVLPGLIDAHTHLTMDTNFDPYHELTMTDARSAITGGHCDDNLLPYKYHATYGGVADGIAEVQHKVRENIKYGADLIKVCATGGVLSKGDDPQASQFTLEEMQAIVADAHRLGRKVAAHAHGGQGILWAAEAGVDSIEHGTYIDDKAIAVMKEKGTYLVPTLYLEDWIQQNGHLPAFAQKKMEEVSLVAKKNIKHAMDSGVKIAMGTDAAVYPHGLNAHELDVYVNQLGMTPIAALQTATVNAADLMGWSAKTGSLEPGKWADVIAVDGDPLKDIRLLQDVKFVMKAGRVYKQNGRGLVE